ncbi:hypothetical protein Ddc_06836 [Ditylenchus destructor]|nr:hypothetical protein Ddc_06836 [Ditylenchus destructor]
MVEEDWLLSAGVVRKVAVTVEVWKNRNYRRRPPPLNGLQGLLEGAVHPTAAEPDRPSTTMMTTVTRLAVFL